MIRKGMGIRRALSAPLAVLLLLPGVTTPVLDRADFEHPRAIEEPGHNPAACPRGHDHNLCTQVRANLPLPAAGTEVRHPHRLLRFTPVAVPAVAPPTPVRGGPRSRAPPTA
jgi:hypothetical protein